MYCKHFSEFIVWFLNFVDSESFGIYFVRKGKSPALFPQNIASYPNLVY